MLDLTQSVTTRRFFDGNRLHGPTRLEIDGGIVAAVEDHHGPCDHDLVTPGLVDLQVNGWRNVDFASCSQEDLATLDHELAALGTTAYLATLISDDPGRMRARAAVLGETRASAPGLMGVHLEGPFLGRMHGAHRPDRVIPIDLPWLADLPALVRLVTLGAEQESAMEAVRMLVAKGVTVSLGHGSPDESQYSAAVGAGARMVTHLFNAMSGVHHRDFGMALAALTDSRVTAGLIADMCHVSPRATRLAFAARPDGVCLVSDSVAWESASFQRTGATVRNGAPRLPDGTLAGSSTSLAGCLRLAVMEAGVDLESALRAATSTPARLIGETGAGTVGTGRSCDLVSFDDDLRVRSVWRRLVSSRGNATDD